MPPILRTSAYLRTEKKALKPYPKSRDEITACVDTLAARPAQGDVYPGLQMCRKVRYPLEAYDKGKSSGVRLIFLVGQVNVLPILMYHKGQYKTEAEIKAVALVKMRQVLEEVRELAAAATKPTS